MKFAAGYQQDPDALEPFAQIVEDYREHLAEIYFPWVGGPSGRAALGKQRGLTDWTAQARLEEDLKSFRDMGLKLDLLFNSNCYGAKALSTELENEVGSIIDHLADAVGGVDIVTTTSLLVARTVKKYFPEVEVRASVNMRIGTVEAFQYVSELFDSFYLQRDRQRNIEYVTHVRKWCQDNDKGLCLLANSGCLLNCPGQSFHDNLVAHDAEIDERKNVPDWTPHVCWNLYKKPENRAAILQATWIRPEDVKHYEGLCDVMKLATRMHSKPRMVLEAYTSGKFSGNLLDIFEPGFGPAFAPYVVDSGAFPPDWFEITSTCARNCLECGYCKAALGKMLVRLD